MCRIFESKRGSYAGRIGATRDAEDVLRAGTLEGLDQALRAGDRPGSLVGRHGRPLHRLLIRHLLNFSVCLVACCVSPTKNPSSRSADEGSTRVLRLRAVSSRVACVRESRGVAQNACCAHHAPARDRRSTQSATRPESWDPASHILACRAVARVPRGQSRDCQVQMHDRLPSGSASTQNAGAR